MPSDSDTLEAADPAAPPAEGGGELDFGYQVSVDQFSGPLDLLLYLVKRTEVDIVDIPIATITDQFVATLMAWQAMDLDVAGDFIVLAATLIEIKARQLAPPPEKADGENEERDDFEDVLDPRSDLIQRLLEYRRFKDAAVLLNLCEDDRAEKVVRQMREAIPEDTENEPEIELEDLDVHHLYRMFEIQMARISGTGPRRVVYDETPIDVRIQRLLERLAHLKRASLSTFLSEEKQRSAKAGVVVATLEVVRQRFAEVEQLEQYGDIHLNWREEDDRAIKTDLPPEREEDQLMIGRRRKKIPLKTFTVGVSDELDEVLADEPEDRLETDEQRFLRELDDSCNLSAVLSSVADVEASFIHAWQAAHDGAMPPSIESERAAEIARVEAERAEAEKATLERVAREESRKDKKRAQWEQRKDQLVAARAKKAARAKAREARHYTDATAPMSSMTLAALHLTSVAGIEAPAPAPVVTVGLAPAIVPVLTVAAAPLSQLQLAPNYLTPVAAAAAVAPVAAPAPEVSPEISIAALQPMQVAARTLASVPAVEAAVVPVDAEPQSLAAMQVAPVALSLVAARDEAVAMKVSAEPIDEPAATRDNAADLVADEMKFEIDPAEKINVEEAGEDSKDSDRSDADFIAATSSATSDEPELVKAYNQPPPRVEKGENLLAGLVTPENDDDQRDADGLSPAAAAILAAAEALFASNDDDAESDESDDDDQAVAADDADEDAISDDQADVNAALLAGDARAMLADDEDDDDDDDDDDDEEVDEQDEQDLDDELDAQSGDDDLADSDELVDLARLDGASEQELCEGNAELDAAVLSDAVAPSDVAPADSELSNADEAALALNDADESHELAQLDGASDDDVIAAASSEVLDDLADQADQDDIDDMHGDVAVAAALREADSSADDDDIDHLAGDVGLPINELSPTATRATVFDPDAVRLLHTGAADASEADDDALMPDGHAAYTATSGVAADIDEFSDAGIIVGPPEAPVHSGASSELVGDELSELSGLECGESGESDAPIIGGDDPELVTAYSAPPKRADLDESPDDREDYNPFALIGAAAVAPEDEPTSSEPTQLETVVLRSQAMIGAAADIGDDEPVEDSVLRADSDAPPVAVNDQSAADANDETAITSPQRAIRETDIFDLQDDAPQEKGIDVGNLVESALAETASENKALPADASNDESSITTPLPIILPKQPKVVAADDADESADVVRAPHADEYTPLTNKLIVLPRPPVSPPSALRPPPPQNGGEDSPPPPPDPQPPSSDLTNLPDDQTAELTTEITDSTVSPSHKRFWLAFAALALLNVLGWLVFSYVVWVPRTILEVSTPVTVREAQPWNFRFNLDVVNEPQIGTTPEIVPTIVPPVPGAWRWTDARTLTFQPTVELPPAMALNIALADKALRTATGLRMGYDLAATIRTPGLVPTTSKVVAFAEDGSQTVDVGFDQAVDPKLLTGRVAVADSAGTSHPATIVSTAKTNTVRVHVAGGEQAPASGAGAVGFTAVPAAAPSLSAPLRVDTTWQGPVILGHRLHVTKLDSFVPARGASIIDLTIDQPQADRGVLRDSIAIKPEVAFTIEDTKQGLRLIGDFKPTQTYQIVVAARHPNGSDDSAHLADYPAAGAFEVVIPDREVGLWLSGDVERAVITTVNSATVALSVTATDSDEPIASRMLRLDGDANTEVSIDLELRDVVGVLPPGDYRLTARTGETVAEQTIRVRDVAIDDQRWHQANTTWAIARIAGHRDQLAKLRLVSMVP